jgi:hypothetical protein
MKHERIISAAPAAPLQPQQTSAHRGLASGAAAAKAKIIK